MKASAATIYVYGSAVPVCVLRSRSSSRNTLSRMPPLPPTPPNYYEERRLRAPVTIYRANESIRLFADERGRRFSSLRSQARFVLDTAADQRAAFQKKLDQQPNS